MSSNLLKDAKKINKQYAENFYSKFLSTKYGVKTCSTLKDITISIIRKQILDWQKLVQQPCEANIEFGEGSIIIPPNQPANVVFDGTQGTIYVNMGGCDVAINVTSKSDNFTYTQSTPSATWVILHNLGYNPVVRTEDSTGLDIEGVITHDTLNQLTILFSEPVSGKAYLS
jgi:hypothetical protein